MSMKIVVTELPQEPKDCLFSKPMEGQRDKWEEAAYDEDYSNIKYVCTLHPHIDDYEAIKRSIGKPNTLCNCKNCNLLHLSNHWSDV